MNHIVTKAIVLRRVDFGEADRIITVLTPDQGKLGLMAKGVRRPKSKLAGGIELFSVSSITFMRGRSELGTLISARLDNHYGNIVRDIQRVQLGYDLIKLLDKITEEDAEADYFTLLHQLLGALDDTAVTSELIQIWFYAQLLRIGGMAPNLHTDKVGKELSPDQQYQFDFDSGTFTVLDGGPYGANHIKFLRLLFSDTQPLVLAKVADMPSLLNAVKQIVIYWQQSYSS
ncbi:DNA repair protein RecO [Candidatus Saccharibacteria bacterium]|nr:DNA repair protein RecO [Candidatus Saccharibacteria bacterium]